MKNNFLYKYPALILLAIIISSIQLVSAQHTYLYGTTILGGAYNGGTIVRFDLITNTEKVVWNFGNWPDGKLPRGNLIFDTASGLFYGMTSAGGQYTTSTTDFGTIFTFDPVTNTEHVIWSFDNTDGSGPDGDLVYSAATGLYYGLTEHGGTGAGGGGTIFSFDPSTGVHTVRYNFDKGNPTGNLVYDQSNGLYYTMTLLGGDSSNGNIPGYGTIISFDPNSNIVNTVWQFHPGTDGVNPFDGTLVYGPPTGLLYGMTSAGGLINNGTIISFDPATNRDSVVCSFVGSGADEPYRHLTYNPATGLFYGTSFYGNNSPWGTIISFDPVSGRDSLLWSFGNGTDGRLPLCTLIFDDSTGIYYGMTDEGGTDSAGTIFSFDPTTATEQVLWSFKKDSDGNSPYNSLVLYRGAVDSCAIISATAIRLSDTSAYATAVGGTPPYTYIWSTVPAQYSDTATHLISDSTYIVTVTDYNSCSGTTTAAIVTPTGIAPLSEKIVISIYPNPTDGIITVTGLKKGQSIAVYNDMSQHISDSNATSNYQQIDISANADGLYLVKILDDDGIVSYQQKILKASQ